LERLNVEALKEVGGFGGGGSEVQKLEVEEVCDFLRRVMPSDHAIPEISAAQHGVEAAYFRNALL